MTAARIGVVVAMILASIVVGLAITTLLDWPFEAEFLLSLGAGFVIGTIANLVLSALED